MFFLICKTRAGLYFVMIKRNTMYFLQLPLEGFPLILVILGLVIWLIGLVTIANSRFRDNTTKLCWFFILLFLSIIGIVLFLFWGRKEVFKPEKR